MKQGYPKCIMLKMEMSDVKHHVISVWWYKVYCLSQDRGDR